MRILRTFVRKGETQLDAICRIAALANQLGYDGYALHCEMCGTRLDGHGKNPCPSKRELSLFILDNPRSIAL